MVQSAQLKATPVPTNSDAKRGKLRPVESFLDLGSVFHLEELRKHMEVCSGNFQVDYLEITLICNSMFKNMDSGTCNGHFGFPSKTKGWSQLHMRVLGELSYLVQARSTQRGVSRGRKKVVDGWQYKLSRCKKAGCKNTSPANLRFDLFCT
jgi:hypothetical protein